jgi:hypothetical protein
LPLIFDETLKYVTSQKRIKTIDIITMKWRKIFAHIIGGRLEMALASSSKQAADDVPTTSQGRENRSMRKPLAHLALVAILAASLVGGSVITPTYGKADTGRQKIISSLISVQFFDCGTAGLVQLSGKLVETVHFAVSSAGPLVVVLQSHTEHVTGTTSSGDKAVFIETSNEVDRFGKEFTIQSHGTLIIKGKGLDAGFTAIFHITFDASGEPIVQVSQGTGKCR